MKEDSFIIEIYDKRERAVTTMFVEKVSHHIFRAVENDLFNCRLTFGTEFETRINKEGKHEIIRITKNSEFITKRFFLTSQFTRSEYEQLGEEVVKNGGFWPVDMGSIATINLPWILIRYSRLSILIQHM